MDRIILFDGPQWSQLFPLTLTRPIAHLLCGGLTVIERWQQCYPNSDISEHAKGYLRDYFHSAENGGNAILINSAWLSGLVANEITSLAVGTALWSGDKLLAIHTHQYDSDWNLKDIIEVARTYKKITIEANQDVISYPEHLTRLNEKYLRSDIDRLTAEQTSVEKIGDGVHVIGDASLIHLVAGATMHHGVINTTNGPVYIGKHATINEGSMLRGPLMIRDGAQINMGAKIYGKTTIGKRCKVGGEVKRSIFMDYSNKGHDGFVGDSVIGSWCNLGADTNTSNMKNTYGKINLWDIERDEKRRTDEQFLGTIMGDHSKCGINTQLSPGTVVGVCANIFDTRPDAFTPSYSWGKDERYSVDKAIEVAQIVYQRRDKTLTAGEEKILRSIYKMTS